MVREISCYGFVDNWFSPAARHYLPEISCIKKMPAKKNNYKYNDKEAYSGIAS
jgi:hypothetical protein